MLVSLPIDSAHAVAGGRRRRGIRVESLLALLVLLACGGADGPGATEPPTDTTKTGNPGDIQKATLTLTFEVEAAHRATADAVGWRDGRIPAATVTLRRSGSTTDQTAVTDPSGQVQFRDLLEGDYVASLARVLTDQEVAKAVAAGVKTNAFGGGFVLPVAAPTTQKSFFAAGGARGTLVISQHGPTFGKAPGSSGYCCGGYVELYNDSDTTIYLDGKTFGNADVWSVHADELPCAESESLRNDPAGLWSMFFYRFPGAGRDHPLEPGKVAVIAADAIDHRPIAEGALDLSGGQFEIIGPADVDNPAVPNMMNLGDPNESSHGEFIFRGPRNVMFIAEFVDRDSLPLVRILRFNFEVRRIPADKVLDVATRRTILSQRVEEQFPYCGQMVHPNFDQKENSTLLVNPIETNSLHRRVLARRAEGRAVLQRTFTSAEDLVKAPPTPGKSP